MPAVPQSSRASVHINVRNTHDGKSSPCLVDVDVLDKGENCISPPPNSTKSASAGVTKCHSSTMSIQIARRVGMP